MKLSKADWTRLEVSRNNIVAAVCKRHGCSPSELFCTKAARDRTGLGASGTKKTPNVAAARSDAVRLLRSLDWHGDSDELSYPVIGKLLCISHSTAVLIIKKFTDRGERWGITLDAYLQQSADTPNITSVGEAGCDKGVLDRDEETRAL